MAILYLLVTGAAEDVASAIQQPVAHIAAPRTMFLQRRIPSIF